MPWALQSPGRILPDPFDQTAQAPFSPEAAFSRNMENVALPRKGFRGEISVNRRWKMPQHRRAAVLYVL